MSGAGAALSPASAGPWREATQRLREIALSRPLQEQTKWGKPCFTLDGAGVVLIQGFKPYCALLFFKGALLRDERGLLVRHGPNVNAARQLRFVDASEVEARADLIGHYIDLAIAAERQGLKVEAAEPPSEPPEWTARLAAEPALRRAFEALTPGRRRVYLMHFSGAKLSATRVARIDRWRSHILDGKGIDD